MFPTIPLDFAAKTKKSCSLSKFELFEKTSHITNIIPYPFILQLRWSVNKLMSTYAIYQLLNIQCIFLYLGFFFVSTIWYHWYQSNWVIMILETFIFQNNWFTCYRAHCSPWQVVNADRAQHKTTSIHTVL